MASVTLDFEQGHIAPGLEPDIDDFGRANIVVASRREGSQATATDDDGPLGTSAIGAYKTEISINPAFDADLAQHAAYHLVLGTDPDPRYAQVMVDLTEQDADLITDVAAIDVGDLITLQNIPQDLGQPTADLLALGYTEVIGSHTRTIAFNTRPGAILTHVGQLDGDGDACLQTTGSQLDRAITAEQVGINVTTTSGPLYTTSPPSGARVIVGEREVTEVTAITSAVSDAFTRTVSNAWGTADIGGAWTTEGGGSASNYAVNGTRATITLPTGDTVSRNILLPGTYAYVDLKMTLSSSQTATGNNINGQARFRSTAGSNYYVLSCAFDTTGNVDVSLFRVLAGASTTLANASNVVAYSPASDVMVRVQAVGSTLRAKVWVGAEPAAWTLETTDSNHSAGQVGVRAFLSSGNTNVNPVLSFDNFEVTNPQTLTVVRDPDQRRVHDADSDVKVYRPLRLLL